MNEAIVFQPYQGTKAPSDEGFWDSLGGQPNNANGIMYIQLCENTDTEEEPYYKIFFYFNNKWYSADDSTDDSTDTQEIQVGPGLQIDENGVISLSLKENGGLTTNESELSELSIDHEQTLVMSGDLWVSDGKIYTSYLNALAMNCGNFWFKAARSNPETGIPQDVLTIKDTAGNTATLTIDQINRLLDLLQ